MEEKRWYADYRMSENQKINWCMMYDVDVNIILKNVMCTVILKKIPSRPWPSIIRAISMYGLATKIVVVCRHCAKTRRLLSFLFVWEADFCFLSRRVGVQRWGGGRVFRSAQVDTCVFHTRGYQCFDFMSQGHSNCYCYTHSNFYLILKNGMVFCLMYITN